MTAEDPQLPQPDLSLLTRIAEGDEAAMRELYARHAGRVFAVASKVSSPAVAEEIVQEIFFSLWKNPRAFDAGKGNFSSWISQVAKHRALNSRRRDSRNAGPIELVAAPVDETPLADEQSWLAHRREVLRAAVESLPQDQRRAVSLAFFDELPHGKVAAVLGAPLGTVKTRIRLGLNRLRLLVAIALTSVLAILGGRELLHRGETDRALRMVTASDVVPLHLSAQAGVPAEAHGSYRARPGVGIAVLTTSGLEANQRYAAWARFGESWVSLGTIELADDGRSVTTTENPALASRPDKVRVTLEDAASGTPGPALLEWSAPR